MKSGITVHCRVRNEEQFVQQAILSILPLAERVLVYDTGSTDSTLEKIAALRSDKVEVICKPPSDPRGICEYRNEMVDRTQTEWYMIVDGDEIYPRSAVEAILKEMAAISGKKDIHRIVLHRVHFIESLNFVSKQDGIGRIYRTSAIKFRLYNPEDNRVGHETPYFPSDPSLPAYRYSHTFSREAYFYHCHYLRRSSRDRDLGMLRRWRRRPFPVKTFLGPWPEVMDAQGAADRMSPALAVRCQMINLGNLWDRTLWHMPWNKKVRGSQKGDTALAPRS